MKINPLSSYGMSIYSKGTPKRTHSAAVTTQDAAVGKTDTISFSAGAREQPGFSQVSGAILKELNEPESPSRLQAIQQAVEKNSYRVSSDDLADAILSRGTL